MEFTRPSGGSGFDNAPTPKATPPRKSEPRAVKGWSLFENFRNFEKMAGFRARFAENFRHIIVRHAKGWANSQITVVHGEYKPFLYSK